MSRFVVFLLSVLACAHATAQDAALPNVVIILADDLGYGDAQCYNPDSTIPTPHLDAVAAQGMRFTDAHSPASLCAPTRFSMLTGNYSYRNSSAFGVWKPEADSGIDTGGWTTSARIAKAGGYQTAFFGKWGLGPSNTSGSPIKQGFDRYYGYNCQRNAHSFYPTFLDSNER